MKLKIGIGLFTISKIYVCSIVFGNIGTLNHDTVCNRWPHAASIPNRSFETIIIW